MNTIVHLDTGLFPDAQTVNAALRQMTETFRVDVVDLRQREKKDADWDEVMQKILAADRVITT